MKKLSIILLSVLLVLSACKNEDNTSDETTGENNTEVSSETVSLEILQFDKSIINKLDGIEGDFLYGYKWKDKMGFNQLIFTTEDKFVEWEDNEYGMGDNYTLLKVYHFAGTEDNYSLVRLVQDGATKCPSEPFSLENEFYEKSISITDLNENGYAEITFMYWMLCASELTPVPTKLIMLENNEKFAIRGDSYIPDFKMGGEKNLDLGNADQVLKDYASKTWDKFCTPNPDVNAQTQQNDDFSTFWQNFQSFVASDNKNAVLALCNQDVKDFISGTGYNFIFDEKMKSEIAKTQASNVKNYDNDKRIFNYIIVYPADENDPNGEVFESSFGFIFGKINGKWMLTVPAFAG